MIPVRNVFLSTEVGEISRFDCMSIIDGRERFERIEVLMVDNLSLVSTGDPLDPGVNATDHPNACETSPRNKTRR
jgi:hypothetical protein